MVAGLLERGELTPRWRPAFESVPRHRYIPDTVYEELDESVDGPDLLPLHRADDPERWLAIAYANSAVKTQVDDGHPDEQGRGRELTSSASQPAVMAEMLTALQLEPGMRVLEIGTGTGYNTALLAYQLGADNVVSVEIDVELAERARRRLAGEGYGDVVVVTGDGTQGWPAAAPYDRVLATVAAHQVPYAWVAQTRPGGQVLVPWGSQWYPASLLRLTAEQDATAAGRIVGSASFMLLRSQRSTRAVVNGSGGGHVDTTAIELHPWYVAAQPDAATAIGFRVSDCTQFYSEDKDRGGRLNLVDQGSRSWARVSLAEEPPYTVHQSGPRRLWDEVTAAYQWWQETGEPAIEDWLVTVGPGGQHIELRKELATKY
jgi:protein-L-isoaspartate(D-aspartate) O-methyltransferase